MRTAQQDLRTGRSLRTPKHAIREDVADEYRKRRFLEPFDLVTPTRASKIIGLFGAIMPWQAKVILTREISI